jgi:hypothetical protein
VHRTVAVVAVAVVAVGVVVAILFPGFDRYRRQASNQVMTVVMLQNIHEALAIYASRCGAYPPSLEHIEAPVSGETAGCTRLGSFAEAVRSDGLYREGDDLGMFAFSVGQLTKLRRTGVYREYGFQYLPDEPMPGGLYGRYVLTADPEKRDVTGFSSFWLSSDGDLRENRGGPGGPRDALLRSLAPPLNSELQRTRPAQAIEPRR